MKSSAGFETRQVYKISRAEVVQGPGQAQAKVTCQPINLIKSQNSTQRAQARRTRSRGRAGMIHNNVTAPEGRLLWLKCLSQVLVLQRYVSLGGGSFTREIYMPRGALLPRKLHWIPPSHPEQRYFQGPERRLPPGSHPPHAQAGSCRGPPAGGGGSQHHRASCETGESKTQHLACEPPVRRELVTTSLLSGP